ncbi:hypothetical protein PAPYR_10414 [Paratrimastix pyriformis]|uniref:Uncharacterized protein n=1 Tax=Paratrimastix pyriformis TaxID=342808 RepID=A0ABQ8UBU5_9EUKA|nr:hypothetical protein PAPYR_10414 [Paratrimastix pyriformis]
MTSSGLDGQISLAAIFLQTTLSLFFENPPTVEEEHKTGPWSPSEQKALCSAIIRFQTTDRNFLSNYVPSRSATAVKAFINRWNLLPTRASIRAYALRHLPDWEVPRLDPRAQDVAVSSVQDVSASVSAPDASAPDVSALSAPDVSAPAPDVSAPAPDVSAPDVSAPDVSAPDVSAPDVSAPDVSAPDVSAPDASAPAPDASAPPVSVPVLLVAGAHVDEPFVSALGEVAGAGTPPENARVLKAPGTLTIEHPGSPAATNHPEHHQEARETRFPKPRFFDPSIFSSTLSFVASVGKALSSVSATTLCLQAFSAQRGVFDQEIVHARSVLPENTKPMVDEIEKLDNVLQNRIEELTQRAALLQGGNRWLRFHTHALQEKLQQVLLLEQTRINPQETLVFSRDKLTKLPDHHERLILISYTGHAPNLIEILPVMQDIFRDLLLNALTYSLMGSTITASMVNDRRTLSVTLVSDQGWALTRTSCRTSSGSAPGTGMRATANWRMAEAYYCTRTFGGTFSIVRDNHFHIATTLRLELPCPPPGATTSPIIDTFTDPIHHSPKSPGGSGSDRSRGGDESPTSLPSPPSSGMSRSGPLLSPLSPPSPSTRAPPPPPLQAPRAAPPPLAAQRATPPPSTPAARPAACPVAQPPPAAPVAARAQTPPGSSTVPPPSPTTRNRSPPQTPTHTTTAASRATPPPSPQQPQSDPFRFASSGVTPTGVLPSSPGSPSVPMIRRLSTGTPQHPQGARPGTGASR